MSSTDSLNNFGDRRWRQTPIVKTRRTGIRFRFQSRANPNTRNRALLYEPRWQIQQMSAMFCCRRSPLLPFTIGIRRIVLAAPFLAPPLAHRPARLVSDNQRCISPTFIDGHNAKTMGACISAAIRTSVVSDSEHTNNSGTIRAPSLARNSDTVSPPCRMEGRITASERKQAAGLAMSTPAGSNTGSSSNTLRRTV